jgi:hypothetical protein
MDGAGRPREIPLKAKYRREKPKGKYRADYDGNTGEHRLKGVLLPMVPGIKRKRFRRKYKQL